MRMESRNIKQEYKNIRSQKDVINLETSRKKDIRLSETPVKRPRRKLCSTKQENKRKVSPPQKGVTGSENDMKKNSE
jgi:hypothetical protein